MPHVRCAAELYPQPHSLNLKTHGYRDNHTASEFLFKNFYCTFGTATFFFHKQAAMNTPVLPRGLRSTNISLPLPPAPGWFPV